MNSLKTLSQTYALVSPPPSPRPSSTGPPLWELSYQGLSTQAYKLANGTLRVYVSNVGSPTFALDFAPPLCKRTYVILPGGDLLLEFSKFHEVGVSSLAQQHTSGVDLELNRIVKVLEGLGRGVVTAGERRTGSEIERFWFEVAGGKDVKMDEAVITVAMFCSRGV